MMPFLRNNVWLITWSLILILLALLTLTLFNENIITEKILIDNKESLGFVGKLLEVAIILIAALLAYFRFFQGHLFLSKLEPKISHKMVFLGENENYHFFEIEINNIGDYTILNPLIKAHINYIPALKEPMIEIIKDGQVRVDEHRGRMNHVVRAKTSTSLGFELRLNNSSIKAIKFEVHIEYKKRIWKRIILVEN